MPQPYNYSISAADPRNHVMQALNLTMGIKQQKLAEAQRAAQAQKAQIAAQRQQEMDGFLKGLVANPTSEAIDGAILRYPHLADKFKDVAGRTAERETESDKTERLGRSQRIYATLDANRPDLAVQYLNGVAGAYDASGRKGDASQIREQIKMIEQDPKTAKAVIGLKLRSSMEPGEFQDSFMADADRASTISETAHRDAETAGVLIKNTAAETKAKQLPDEIKADYTTANASELAALKDLSKTYEILSNVSGIPAEAFVSGTLGEIKKNVQEKISGQAWGDFGPQLTLLGSQLSGQRLSEAMKMKASGALSEGEMNELLKTTPPAGSSKKVYTDWIMARIKATKTLAAVDSIQKAYLLDQKSLLPYGGKSKKLYINGKPVTINKGDDANRLIAKIGRNLHQFSPQSSFGEQKTAYTVKTGKNAGKTVMLTQEQLEKAQSLDK